jgi:capsular polysaccharide transport system permease protein
MSTSTSPDGLAGAFRTQLRVLGALTLREMSARFGKENLGYLWLFGEPALLGGAIGVLHALTGHEMPGGLDPAFFMLTGYVMFYLLRGVMNRAPSMIYGTQSLLYHRCITLLDIVVSKNLLETAASTFVMALFLAGYWMVKGQRPAHFEVVMAAMLLMGLLAHGFCLLLAAGSVYTEVFERVTHLFTYLTMPFTGCFYMAFWLPTDLQKVALWNPTLHIFEMMRYGLYGLRVPTHFDVPYILASVAVLNLLGMAALRGARRHLVI